MPYDGILIHFLTSELSEKLVGGKINKIIEPNALDLCLQIRSKDQTDKQIKNYQLFISSSLDFLYVLIVLPCSNCCLDNRYSCATIYSVSGNPWRKERVSKKR